MDQFSKLIVEQQKLIYKVCHMYADLPEDVEDLFQEIVLNLWRAYPSFEKRSQVSTWLYKVAPNTAITQFRKVTRQQTNEQALDFKTIPAVAHGYDATVPTLNNSASAIASFNGVDFLSYELIEQDNNQYQFQTLWPSTNIIADDYTLFVHLLDEDGIIVAQADGPIQTGGPTNLWAVDDEIQDVRLLPIPDTASHIRLGFYDPVTNSRLSRFQSDGNPDFVDLQLP